MEFSPQISKDWMFGFMSLRLASNTDREFLAPFRKRGAWMTSAKVFAILIARGRIRFTTSLWMWGARPIAAN
jgi:hypothetical protein